MQEGKTSATNDEPVSVFSVFLYSVSVGQVRVGKVHRWVGAYFIGFWTCRQVVSRSVSFRPAWMNRKNMFVHNTVKEPAMTHPHGSRSRGSPTSWSTGASRRTSPEDGGEAWWIFSALLGVFTSSVITVGTSSSIIHTAFFVMKLCRGNTPYSMVWTPRGLEKSSRWAGLR